MAAAGVVKVLCITLLLSLAFAADPYNPYTYCQAPNKVCLMDAERRRGREAEGGMAGHVYLLSLPPFLPRSLPPSLPSSLPPLHSSSPCFSSSCVSDKFVQMQETDSNYTLVLVQGKFSHSSYKSNKRQQPTQVTQQAAAATKNDYRTQQKRQATATMQ